MILSICIPTYNRKESLYYCLKSLAKQTTKEFEVCISDNSSNYNIKELLKPFKKKLNLKVNINKKNLGFAKNVLKVTSMAKGDYIWLLGDDDLLINDSVKSLLNIINKNKFVKFFWVNTYHLSVNYIRKYNKNFDKNIYPDNIEKHSKVNKDMVCNFFDLIDKNISFDYLLGIFVCVFHRSSWKRNLHVVNYKLLDDVRIWSNFENTCFFIKIFCSAFSKSKAYIISKPLSISLYGIREWNDLYPFVEIVRIPEALDYYRSQGLGFWRYILNKNYSLRNFFNYFIKIMINDNRMGKNYVNFKNHFLKNLIYPNAWLSILYFVYRKIFNIFKKN